MLEVLSQDYMRVAKAKGLTDSRVLWRHGLKNAFIPIFTVIGLEIGYLLGGTVIIEDLFAFPGLGKQTVTAMLQRDLPVLQGTLLFYSTIFVLVNLLVDLSYGFIDPRVSHE
jgi:peptide/nickel transport system permease protein